MIECFLKYSKNRNNILIAFKEDNFLFSYVTFHYLSVRLSTYLVICLRLKKHFYSFFSSRIYNSTKYCQINNTNYSNKYVYVH